MDATEMQAMIAAAVAAALSAQATQTPKEEAIVTNEEMAKRVEAHNSVLKKDVDNRKEKLYTAFDFGKEESDFTGPADRRQECFSDVMSQACWGISNGSAAQYMWHRMLADNAYLQLSNIREQNGGVIHTMSQQDESEKHYEQGMEPNRDYTAIERNYAYHIATGYAYEVNMHAAYSIWQEIQDEKAEAFYEKHQGDLDAVYINRSRAPNHDIGESAYTAYLEKRAKKDEQGTLKQGQHAMQAARLLRLTLHANAADES
jgi:hypothetical protein